MDKSGQNGEVGFQSRKCSRNRTDCVTWRLTLPSSLMESPDSPRGSFHVLRQAKTSPRAHGYLDAPWAPQLDPFKNGATILSQTHVYLPSCTTQVFEPPPCSHHSHQNEPTSHVLLMCVHKCSVAKLCPTLCNSMDRSPSGSPVRVISQVRILE